MTPSWSVTFTLVGLVVHMMSASLEIRNYLQKSRSWQLFRHWQDNNCWQWVSTKVLAYYNGRLGANQRRFNRIISSARRPVERCFGYLKGRFKRIRKIPFISPWILSLIVSGCILHNLCILHEDDVNDFIDQDGLRHPSNYQNIFRNDPIGTNRRLAIMARLP